MSSDIYAKPDLSKKVRYNRNQQEDGEGRVERMVDIYESVESIRDDPTDFQPQEGGPHTQKQPPVQRRPVKAAVLCFLMTAGIITLSICCILLTVEKDQLQNRYNNLSNNHIQLQTRYNNLNSTYIQLQEELSDSINNNSQLQDEVKRLRGNTEGKWCPEGWRRFGCSCYFKSTESKSWFESRKHCQDRGADLVIINNKEEQEFVTKLIVNGEFWIGLRNIWKQRRYQWEWVDGSPLTQTLWTEYPTDGYYASCCDGQGKWKREDYYNKKNWICEIKISCSQ